MADQSAKPFPPSSSRIAHAARQGLFIQSPILMFGIILISTSLVAIVLLNKMTAATFLTLPSRVVTPIQLNEFIFLQLHYLFYFCVAMSLPVMATSFAAFVMVRKQKRNGQSNVTIDSNFSTFRSDLFVGILTSSIAAVTCIAIARNSEFEFSQWANSPVSAGRQLSFLFLWCCAGSGAVSVIGGILQLSSRKVLLYQHLALSKSEVEKELRLQGRSPLKKRFSRYS